MDWLLSPRWQVRDDSQACLIGPNNERIDLDPNQYEAVGSGRLQLAPLISSDNFPEIMTWVKGLIASRVMVPEYLGKGQSPNTEAEDFFLEIFEAVCGHLSCSDIWPQVRNGILSWSGPVLRQPLDAPEDYFPSRPSLCLDLLGNSRRGVRLALDCRDPLCTPWENIRFVRQTFGKHLKCRTDLFDRINELVFDNPSRFRNPRVKYLHPAIDYLPGGEEISAYWNLGNTETKEELWDRSAEVLEAVGGECGRLSNFRDAFGSFSQPELIGHTFDICKPPILKTYVMFDGLNTETLREILDVEDVLAQGTPVIEALLWLERNRPHPGRNLGIASLYHPLEPGAKSGIKVHLNLRDGFERKFKIEEIMGTMDEILHPAGSVVPVLPGTLELREGRAVEVLPYTLSLMFVPGDGLTKVTLYVNF